MHAEHVAVNWNQAWTRQRWYDELRTQLTGAHSVPCLVSRDGREIAYVELYRVVRDKLGDCYPLHPRDLGVHIAIGEPDAIGRGLGSSLLRAVARGLQAADPECRRVVAEGGVAAGTRRAVIARGAAPGPVVRARVVKPQRGELVRSVGAFVPKGQAQWQSWGVAPGY